MSIAIDKLSLLGSLSPLRQQPDNNPVQQDSGFADKLDKALGSGESSVLGANQKARELAQSLTLQMLQTSLSLSAESAVPTGAASPGTPRFLSADALLQAYGVNLSTGGDRPGISQGPHPTQLHELTDGMPAADLPVRSSGSNSDTAWLDPIIAKASRKYGVDTSLIKAVIKAESDFNPQAVSHAGARGLMQLMPATARSLGIDDSFDPEQNVMGGTRFLKDMLQRYSGNVDSALAAYNWGPGNVDKRPDHLPRETRDYLARVKQLYASYNG